LHCGTRAEDLRAAIQRADRRLATSRFAL